MDDIVRACADGPVRFSAPSALTGELEVFARGEVLALIGARAVAAPTDGFVTRRYVAEGTLVRSGDPILVLRCC